MQIKFFYLHLVLLFAKNYIYTSFVVLPHTQRALRQTLDTNSRKYVGNAVGDKIEIIFHPPLTSPRRN